MTFLKADYAVEIILETHLDIFSFFLFVFPTSPTPQPPPPKGVWRKYPFRRKDRSKRVASGSTIQLSVTLYICMYVCPLTEKKTSLFKVDKGPAIFLESERQKGN